MSRMGTGIGLSFDGFATLPPKLRYRVLEVLLRWEEQEEALTLARKLVDLEPQNPRSRSLLAQCLAACGQMEEAKAVVEDLELDHPGGPFTLSAAADFRFAAGDYPGALECYLSILRANPNSSGVHRRLAALYLEVGQLDRAYSYCQLVLSASKGPASPLPEAHPGVLRTLAAIHEKRGDLQLVEEIRRELSRRRSVEIEKLAALLKQEPPSAPATGIQPDPVTISNAQPSQFLADAEKVLKETFGIQALRLGQAEAIRAALEGESQLVVMPTGGGKSLCYQLPAAVLEGTTLVISPLIALMKDQVEGLPDVLRKRTTFVNSSLDPRQLEKRLSGIARGDYKLVYAAPERLRQAPFIHALKQARLALFVVDEVHCVSIWGHDFRPDYLFIAPVLRTLGQPPLLGMTATATPEMRSEIENQLGRKLSVVTTATYRNNLRLEVKDVRTEDDRMRALVAICREAEGTGIVYAASRKSAEQVASVLWKEEIKAGFYHAGMETDDRNAAQEAFMHGKIRVMAATVAFGMGIDKPDVRFVVHYSLPRSVESYYQEAGRAGRDGLPSRCVLLYASKDKNRLIKWTKQDRMDIDCIKDVYQSIKTQIGGNIGIVDDKLICRTTALDETRVRVAVSMLERVGLIRRHLDLPRNAVIEMVSGATCGEGKDPAFERLAASLEPGQETPFDMCELARTLEIPAPEVELLLLRWSDAGLIRFESSARGMLIQLLRPQGKLRGAIEQMLDDYEAHALRKVDMMDSYARSPVCRHGFIASYFGEEPISDCGACDNCQGGRLEESTHGREQLSEPELRNVQDLVLKGTAELDLPFGRRALIRAFTGSPMSPITRHEWHFLGSLSHLSSKTVGKVIDGLILKGYLHRSGKPLHPVLKLTKQGWEKVEELGP